MGTYFRILTEDGTVTEFPINKESLQRAYKVAHAGADVTDNWDKLSMDQQKERAYWLCFYRRFDRVPVNGELESFIDSIDDVETEERAIQGKAPGAASAGP